MASTPDSFIQTRWRQFSPKLQAWLKTQASGGLDRIEKRATIVVLCLSFAYVCSVIVGSLVGSSFVSSIISARARMAMKDSASAQQVPLDRPMMANVRDLQKNIKERNIFNSEGKFPEEKFGVEGGGGSLKRFDINAPCSPTTLQIELMGTIFLGDSQKSIATVRDKNYSEADVYKVGDSIYGNEMALVAAVERQKIVINNNGVKECIDLDRPLPGAEGDGFPGGFGGDFGSNPMGGGGGGSEITLEASYVESELGAGFGKIVDAARLVPNTNEGGINGFKIFAIKGGSLFSRIGLQNGDVITQVNDTSLRQPEQGFALYQTFQDEKSVRIQLLRGGTTPHNITVQIK